MADKMKGDLSSKQDKKSDTTKEGEKKSTEEPKEQELVIEFLYTVQIIFFREGKRKQSNGKRTSSKTHCH